MEDRIMQWKMIFIDIYKDIIAEVGEIEALNIDVNDIDSLDENVSMADLGIHSLFYMKLLISLEDKYPQLNTETLMVFDLNEPLSAFFAKLDDLFKPGQER